MAAQEPPARERFLRSSKHAKTEALSRGVSAARVERALTGLEPSPTVIERDQTQAEIVLTVDQYAGAPPDAPVRALPRGRWP